MSNILWSEQSFLRPLFISDDAWQKTLSNFGVYVTNPLEDLPSELAEDLARLETMGFASPTALMALQFKMEQAGDFGSIAVREALGSMGQGWASLADVKLLISDHGLTMSGVVDPVLLVSLDATRTAQYTASLSLGKVIGQDGRFMSDVSVTRPTFTLEQRTSNGMILEYITGGYRVKTLAGDQYLFDETGKLELFITATGEEITVTYDINDRLWKYENAFSDYLEFTYDSSGKIETVEDGNGKVVSFTYDINDLLSDVAEDAGDSEFTYNSDGYLLTAQRVGGLVTTLTYDAQGRVASQDLGGVSETYTYDNAGAITITNELMEDTVVQIGLGGFIAGIENNLGHGFNITVDSSLQTITIADPNGVESTLTYDLAGKLQSATDGNDDTVSFGYDLSTGRMVSFTDGEGNSRTFGYDGSGRLLSATWEDDTVFQFDYDVDGNMIEFTNRRGQSVEYDHDARGRVTDISDSASGELSYTYDSRGNVNSITSTAGITEITYDSADRITLIEYPNGRSLTYTYDVEGKRLSMVNQDNEGTFYDYDSAGRLGSVSDDNSILVSYDYDTAGRLILETNANGSYTEYDYDTAGRMDEITNYDSATAVTSFYQYSFDLAGRKTGVVTNDGSWVYDYDDAGQLIEANFTSTTSGIPSKSIDYSYDNAGNRIATVEDSTTTNYTTNDLNQYTAAGGKSFTYDDDGNLTAQTATSNSYSYVYDIDNRLIQVTKPDSSVISYEYDAFGNRSAMVDNGVRTEFLIDPLGMSNVVAEYDSFGARIASYTHGLGLVSRTDATGGLAFYDMDATGNIIGLTNNSGVLANSYIYTPFGDELYESETILNSFEFNGAFGVAEDADNLHYMRARTYDVELGRFLSEDPLFLNGDIRNLYRFGYNDPIQYVDPNGENPAVIWAGGQVLIGAVNGYYASEAIKAAIDSPSAAGPAAAGLTTATGGMALATKSLPYIAGLGLGAFISLLKNPANAQEPNGGGNGGNGGDGRPDGPPGGGGDNLPPPPLPPRKPDRPDDQGSPLVLDLDGDGIELYALGDYGTYFDLRGIGQAVLTGWVQPDDGLLALPGANGIVDGISELFGTQTTDGFAVLKAHDSNSDGRITSADTNFGNFRVWTDINSDGVSQAAELHTLASLNITSIDLGATRVIDEIAGNLITHESTFTMNGVEKTVVDAWFTFDPLYTRNSADYNFDVRTAFLPTLKGFGNLKDLHISASADNNEANSGSLIARMIDLSESITLTTAMTDWDALYGEVETLLWRWAGVESVSTTGRGNYVDGRHLAFYEAFMGEPFNQNGRSNPLIEAGRYVEAVYEYLVTFHAMQMIVQVAGAEIYDAPSYSLYRGANGGDLDLVQSGIDAVKDAAILATDAGEVWARFAQFIGYTKGFSNLSVGEIAALDTAVDATGQPGLDDWQDVVSMMTATLGSVMDSADDWGSFEVYYDNLTTGTSGNDTITENNANGYHDNEFRGGDGNDSISAGDGHDKLMGQGGNDTLIGGTGDDYMLGGLGDDLYHWEGGNDTISEVGGGGYDELHILSSTGLTSANVTDLYRYGDQLMVLLSTGDFITVHKYAEANSALEKIIFDSNASVIDLAAIIEQKFYGTAGADTLTLTGASYQTLLAYGYASNDTIEASGATAKFYGGDGYDTLIGDYLPDFLYGEGQEDYLFGQGGNDTLYGGDGNDRLMGGADADTLYGQNGNDVLDGGSGNDLLEGRDGNDTYLFGLGYGQDIAEELSLYSGSTNDKVNFLSGILPGDVIVTRASNDGILLSISGTSDTLLLRNQETYSFDSGKIESVNFSNGIVWDPEDLRLMAIDTATTSGNDTVYGFDRHSDYLDAGTGNDYVNGGEGSDTYIFGLGYGQDIFEDKGNFDTVTILSGINPNDFVVTRGTNDSIVLSVTGTSDTLTFLNQERYSFNVYRLDQVVFANSTVWTDLDLREMAIASQVTSGNDTVTAFITNDEIMGGAGNDTLKGREGNDIYYYNLGDGQDIFEDLGGTDQIKLGAGIVLSDLSQSRTGNDLLVTISALPSSSILIKNHFASSSKVIEKIVFSDNSELNIMPQIVGTSGNDILSGTSGADLILGRAGNDTINGNSGGDEVLGEDGNDTISGGSGNDVLYGNDGNDIINGDNDNDEIYGDAGDDTLNGNDGLDSVYGGDGADTINGGDDSDTLYGGIGDDVLRGDSGSDSLDGEEGNDTLDGGSGVDTIYGGLGDDTLYGGTGTSSDSLYGGDGDDTYQFTDTSGGDTVSDISGTLDIIAVNENVGPQSLNFSVVNTDHLRIAFSNSNYYMNIVDHLDSSGSFRIEKLTFTNGFWLDLTTYPGWVFGTASAQTISGTGNSDTILGRSGNDILSGGAGSDFLSGDAGSDTINGGDGDDKIHGGSDNDTVNGDGGHDQIYGFTGNDTLRGNVGNDYLNGGTGDDLLEGGSGDDEYHYTLSDGYETIEDTDGFDIIKAYNVSIVNVDFDHVGNNLVINLDAAYTSTITVKNFYASSNSVERLYLANNDTGYFNLATQSWVNANTAPVISSNGGGATASIQLTEGNTAVTTIVATDVDANTTLTYSIGGGLDSSKFSINSTTGALSFASAPDYSNPTDSNTNNVYEVQVSVSDGNLTDTQDISVTVVDLSVINGTSSADTLTGTSAADIMSGLGGNDTMSGGDGDDLIEGGTGNDTINGGSGIDTVSYINASGGVQVNVGSNFASGSDGNDGLSNVENIIGSGYDDTLSGSVVSNTLRGGAGNDQIFAGGGGDQIFGEDGNDYVLGITGSDLIDGGSGTDAIDYWNIASAVSVNLTTGITSGGAGSDTLVSIENLYGTSYGDTFIGNASANILNGYAGNDYIEGGAGNDTLSGGDGIDTLAYSAAASAVTINLATNSATGGDGTDTISGFENVTGSAYNDTITGNYMNNAITGGEGDDTFIASTGTDSYFGGFGSDIVDYSALSYTATINLSLNSATINGKTDYLENIENIKGSTQADTITGDGAANIIDAWTGHDTISGLGGNDHLKGNTGNDTLYGGDGDDKLEGGVGTDNIYGGDGADQAFYSVASTNFVVYRDHADYIIVKDAGNTNDASGYGGDKVYNDVESIAFSDVTLDLTSVTFDLNGVGWGTSTVTLTTATTYQGYNARDIVNGHAGSDVIYGNFGNDDLYGNAGTDTLYGGAGNDNLYGGDSNDTLDGGAGDDVLDGGNGTDLVTYSSASSGVNVNLTTGVTTGGAGSDTISNVEQITGSAYADVIVASAVANLINGGDGEDIIEGTNDSAADVFHGGNGFDTLSYANATALVSINSSTASGSSINTDTHTGFENFVGSAYNDSITGNTLNNFIWGGAGNDTLRGGDGADTLYGEDGADLFVGGAGNDVFEGGNGTDHLYLNDGTTAATVNLALGTVSSSSDGSDTFTSIEQVTGTIYADTITGDSGNNIINGSSGNDIIEGGDGDDIISGANDTDTVVYANASSGVTVNLATTTSQNTVGAGNDTLSSMENLIASLYADTITGSTVANVIDGGAGNDTINGSDGNDTLIGGAGDDSLTGGNGTDAVSYASATSAVNVNLATTTAQNTGGAGTDTLATLEDLTGSAYNDALTGNSSANTIIGGDGNDIIEGAGGNDILTGGNGTDTVSFAGAASAITFNLSTTTSQNTVGAGSDTVSGFENVTGSAYNDTLTGDASSNTIIGGAGNDTLSGGDGNDVLYGNSGLDNLTGGNGADSFVFEAASAYSNIDTISDFSTASNDALNLVNLLGEYDPLTEAITDFVQMTTSGSDTLVSVDRDGTGSTYGFTQIATMTGVTGLTDESALVTSGNLIVT